MMPIHPDDVLLFTEICDAMRVVAKKYNLPLKSISGYPMPQVGMVDRMGDCNGSGDIRLVLRCTVDGQWCDAPIDPDHVWTTAAHELAHLRHLNHGEKFNELSEELQFAMKNQKKDHRQKMIDKLIKLQNQRQGEAELGNVEAAEAFAAMIAKLFLEYELNPSDLDYARASDDDPVIEIAVQPSRYNIEETKVRVAWQESLAMAVANAHLCTILIRPSSNFIKFVGTRSHATVAEYVYGTMVAPIAKMSKAAEIKYWKETGCGRGANNQAKGFRASWIDAFITRIWQRFAEVRRESIAKAAAEGGLSSERGLIRLDGAMQKVRKYIDDKFGTSKAARSASRLTTNRHHDHAAGRAAGREAADRITLGKRGLTGGNTNKQIG